MYAKIHKKDKAINDLDSAIALNPDNVAEIIAIRENMKKGFFKKVAEFFEDSDVKDFCKFVATNGSQFLLKKVLGIG
jgi:hypothetical protein